MRVLGFDPLGSFSRKLNRVFAERQSQTRSIVPSRLDRRQMFGPSRKFFQLIVTPTSHLDRVVEFFNEWVPVRYSGAKFQVFIFLFDNNR